MNEPTELSRYVPDTLQGKVYPSHPEESARLYVPETSRFALVEAMVGHPPLRSAAFLDRDGVLVEDPHLLGSPAQLRVLTGVPEALRGLQVRFAIIVVTNQSGVARGLFAEEALQEAHQELVRLLHVQGAVIDAVYYCPHLPGAPVAAYRQECQCRKPKPGMLLQAQRDWGLNLESSFIVGDSARDVQAGWAAGVRGIFIGTHGASVPGAFGQAPDLAQAADIMLESSC